MKLTHHERMAQISPTYQFLILMAIIGQFNLYNCDLNVNQHHDLKKSAARIDGLKHSLKPRIKRHQHQHERDFAPKLTHQQHSIQLDAHQAHTFECPVESQPESEIRWFKDNQLLDNVDPSRVSQMGSELMFIQLDSNDTGDYYCEATNYLGSIASERFRLTVKSSVHNPSLRLEPPRTEVNLGPTTSDQPVVELTCNVPVVLGPEASVSWRRDGRPLPVVWLHQGSTSGGGGGSTTGHPSARYLARQKSQHEFVLRFARLEHEDLNVPITCLVNGIGSSGAASNLNDNNGELAHESNGAIIIATTTTTTTTTTSVSASDLANGGVSSNNASRIAIITIPNDMAPPVQDILEQNRTLVGEQAPEPPRPPARTVSSLGETLRDLYEIARPTLIIFAVLLLVGLALLLQFIVIRKRARDNRYMKHHHHHHHHPNHLPYHHHNSANNSGGSGSSSCALGTPGVGYMGAGFVGGDCVGLGLGDGATTGDPVLSSLLSRTLSAPSSARSLVTGQLMNKKYKSYRDHMRKVAASNDLVSNDFMDVAYNCSTNSNTNSNNGNGNGNGLNHQIGTGNEQQQQQDNLSCFATSNGPILPNLYNQSLAAREQARNLLHQTASDHMRSLSNLTKQQQPANSNQFAVSRGLLNANGSHLNLPSAFNLGLSAGETNSNRQQQQQQHQQLGPLESGASSLLINPNAATAAIWPQHQQLMQFGNNQQQQQQQHQMRSSLEANASSNENYPLVSCSSISPSSSTSTSSSSNGSGNCVGGGCSQQKTTSQTGDRPMVSLASNARKQTTTNKTRRESITSNHYSTIEANDDYDVEDHGHYDDDDDDNRYEELKEEDDDAGRIGSQHANSSRTRPTRASSKNRISSFLTINDHQQSFLSSSNSSSSGCGDSCTTTGSSLANGNQNDTRSSVRLGGSSKLSMNKGGGQHGAGDNNNNNKGTKLKPNKFQDQLSPYAVSSICNNVSLPLPPVPSSEAMRALKEQFDINQLILLQEEGSQTDQHPFGQPPPPPPLSSQSSSNPPPHQAE